MIIINLLFKMSFGISWLEAEWTAGDALTFFGTILAAITGIVGVYISIKKKKKDYQEDFKNRVLPYLNSNLYVRL